MSFAGWGGLKTPSLIIKNPLSFTPLMKMLILTEDENLGLLEIMKTRKKIFQKP